MRPRIVELSPAYEVMDEEGKPFHFQRDVTFEFQGNRYRLTVPNPPEDEVGLRQAVRQTIKAHLRATLPDWDDPRHRIVGEDFEVQEAG